MKRLLMMIGTAAVACGASADEFTHGGLTWTYTADGTSATLSACSGNPDFSFDAADIPWTFEKDGTTYTVTAYDTTFKSWSKLTGALSIPDAVTALGSFQDSGVTSLSFGSGATSIPRYCFKDCKSLVSSIIIPETITDIGLQAFNGCSKVSAVWIKGPETSPGSPCTINRNSFSSVQAKVFLAGPNTKPSDTSTGFALGGNNKCKAFIPANGEWGSFTDANVTRLLYGEGQELDIAINESTMVLTATVTTENALTNVLASAANFKQYFGLDTVISITNNIAAQVEITEEMLNDVTLNVPTWYMTFAVKTQAQLDHVLGVVTGPIVADITGATEEITTPVGRRVAILAPGGAVFNYKKSGLIISFR